MRKFLHYVTCAAMILSLSTGMKISASTSQSAKLNPATTNSLNRNARQWKSSPSFVKPEISVINPNGLTLGPSGGYSFIKGPDGTQWYATQTFTKEQYYFTASEITLYNNKGEEQGKISVAIPDTVSCNQIFLGDAISATLFDRDKTTYEVPVITHLILSPGVTTNKTYIYDLASGELKHSYDGFMSIHQYYTGYSYEWVGVNSYSSTVDGVAMNNYDIYSKPGWSSTSADLKKSFSIPAKLAEYQVGGAFNVFEVDNSLYYVVSQYEKEYLDSASYQEPWDIIPTEGNNFIATVYNKNFVELGKVTIPVASTSQYLIQHGVGTFGYDDLSKDFWDNSGSMHLIVANTGFQVNTEEETTAFDVYDMAGTKIKTMASNVSDWIKMYDISGKQRQIAFLSQDGTSLSMIDLPACDTVVTFGTAVGGNVISTNIDRYPVADSYQYVIALAEPEYDDNNNILQRIAWVNQDATIDHVVKFNVGTNNASWTPLIMGEALNPYLFDTDSQREYMFIANQYAEGATSGAMTDEIRIVKEDGSILRTIVEDQSTKGDFGSSTLFGLDGTTPTLAIPYYNSTNDNYSIDLEFLPFEMFSQGGDGSAANPYLISSIGDMAMIARNTAAHYKIVNSFSAGDYGLWSAIPTFTGSLDGDNYSISDLMLNGAETSAAIFATSEGATIKNITLESPSVEITDAGTVGFIVAEALTDTIENIHINNASITGGSEAYASIGAIAGSAMLNTVISDCYISNLLIEAESCSNVGGIAGDTRTASAIKTCAVQGKIKAASTIGGIAGANGTDCPILNCHTDINIAGQNTIGGIAGSAERGGIHHCYVEGILSATEANWSGYYSVGGIAGSLATDWSETVTTDSIWNGMVISNNLIAISAINSASGAVHRIVGYTRWDEDVEAAKYDSSITPIAEHALSKNYVVSTLNPIDKSVEANDSTTEGADIALADINPDFLAGLGFKFGNDVENPWNTESTNDPGLYFEPIATDGIEEVTTKNAITINYNGSILDIDGAVSFEIYNLNGVKIATGKDSINASNLTKGIYVIAIIDINGKRSTTKIAVK